MIKRIISLCLVIIVIGLGYMQKNVLLELINEGGTLSILISMLFVAICVFFPILPFTVLAGIIGAVFGVGQGMLISLTGAMAGTMGFFFLSRYGFRDFAEKKLMKYPKVVEYEQLLERNSFIAILACRLIPVIPAPVVNSICGLSRVNWVTFFIASTIGKIPNVLVVSFAGASFNSNKIFSLGLYGIYVLIVFTIALIIFYRRTSKG